MIIKLPLTHYAAKKKGWPNVVESVAESSLESVAESPGIHT
jgi:hypothetical protein